MSHRPKGAYAASGVDLDLAARIKGSIAASVDSTRTDLVRTGFGAFGGAFSLPPGYTDPVLVTSIDGVGTKLHLALDWGRPEVAGADVVNHCIDDIAVLAARPIAFTDYIASGGLEADTVGRLLDGMAAACRASGVALVGGETALMPDTYRVGAYDLAGSIVGVVEREAVPDVGDVKLDDVILGLPSTGPHTNGYSLARRTAEALGPGHPVGEGTLADALLAPHPSYLPELQAAFAMPGVRVAAHITGGGLEENVPRVLPDHLGARFDVGAWSVPPVFDLIAADQGVDRREMYRVFNMGIGLAIVVAPDAAEALLAALSGAFRAGRVVERGDPAVVLSGL
jgi:phosphoribosylformylglycinamidine cyclo-ligase